MKTLTLLLALFICSPAFAASLGDMLPITDSSGKITQKYHKPECEYYYCRDCTARFPSRQAARKAGYTPCKVCWK